MTARPRSFFQYLVRRSPPGAYERYVVSKYGNGWMVVDTEDEKITEANAWLIAKALMMDHDGWENGEFWKGEKWLPITFWNNEIKDEEYLAALVYSWGNDLDVFDESGECRSHFTHKDWSVSISENMEFYRNNVQPNCLEFYLPAALCHFLSHFLYSFPHQIGNLLLYKGVNALF